MVINNLTYVATLPCKTHVTKQQAINDKLQGSLATHLRCDDAVNNRIKKGLLLRLKAVHIWQSWKQERDFLLHFVHLA